MADHDPYSRRMSSSSIITGLEDGEKSLGVHHFSQFPVGLTLEPRKHRTPEPCDSLPELLRINVLTLPTDHTYHPRNFNTRRL